MTQSRIDFFLGQIHHFGTEESEWQEGREQDLEHFLDKGRNWRQ